MLLCPLYISKQYIHGNVIYKNVSDDIVLTRVIGKKIKTDWSLFVIMCKENTNTCD